MRLVQLDIEGFGSVSGTIKFPQESLVLMVDRNEAGKSTLANALFFTLFGVPDGNRDKDLYRIANRYLPWDGKPFRTSLTLHTGDRLVRITREFGSKRTTRVSDANTFEDLTSQFMPGRKDLIGETITGLTSSEALQTMFIPQSEMTLSDDRKSLTNTIQRIATSAAGDNTVTSAISVLEESLTKYPFPKISKGAKIGYEITQLEQEIARCRDAIVERETERERCLHLLDREQAIEQRMSYLDQAANAMRKLQDAREYDQVREMVEQSERVYQEWEKCRNRIELLDEFARIPLELARPIDDNLIRLKDLTDTVRTDEAVLLSIKKEERNRQEQIGLAGIDKATTTQHDTLTGLRASYSEYLRDRQTLQLQLSGVESRLQSQGIEPTQFELAEQKWISLSSEDEIAILTSMEKIAHYIESKRNLEQQKRELDANLLDGKTQQLKQEKTRLAFISIGILIGITGAVLATLIPEYRWVSIGVAVAGFAFSIVNYRSRLSTSTRNRVTIEDMQVRIDENDRNLSELETDYRNFNMKLETLGKQVGVVGNKELVIALQKRNGAKSTFLEWINLRQREQEISDRQQLALSDISRNLRELGKSIDPTDLSINVIDESLRYIDKCLIEQDELNRIRRQRIAKEAEYEDRQHRVVEIEKELSNQLLKAGANSSLPLDQQRDWYAAACRHKLEWNTLKAEYTKLSEQLIEPMKLAHLKQRLHALEQSMDRSSENIGFPEFDLDNPGSTLIKIENEHRELEAERSDLNQLLIDFQRRWSQIGTLQSKLHELDNALDQTRHYETATRLAIDVLRSLSEETHREWSKQLNNIADRYIDQFQGSVKSIHFGTDLSVKAQLLDGRLLNEEELLALSVGARDQIYLSLRLALIDFLSGTSTLPIICDEPFASSDDVRFYSGMDLLLAESTKRQIIILTCHELRHRKWVDDKNVKIAWLPLQLEQKESSKRPS